MYEDIDTLKKTKSIISHPVIYSKFILMELLNALQGLLTHNDLLDVLMLEGLPLYGRYMMHLSKGLCSNRSIKVLSFARSNIGDEACEILCSNIKHLTNIESVNLSQCNLGVKGATSIRDFIRFQKIHRFSEAWIQSLRYQNINEASFDGVKKILINNNPQIGDEGLKIITDELQEDVWIKEIEMQNCGLTDTSADEIMKCLQINKTILNFNVSNNLEISDYLLRHIIIQLGNSSGDTESSDSSDTKSIQQKVSKVQLIDNLKFLEDQLESEIFRRKELEKVNEQLHKQLIEIQKEVSIQSSSLHIPEGYTLVTNETLGKIVAKKSSHVAHKTRSSAVIRMRRKKTTVKKTRSFIVDSTQQNLAKSKSENIIKVDVKPKKIFIEKNIGDSIEIGNNAEENLMTGADLLKCFTRRKKHVSEEKHDSNPRAFFACRSGLKAPLNSDADSDE